MKCECGTTLCPEHQQSFLDILADVPGRLSTMNVSIMKQAVMGGQGGSPKNDDDRPLPLNLGAVEAQRELMVVLGETCRRVRHCLPEGSLPSYGSIPAWMAGLMPRIVLHPESVDWYHAIKNAYEKTSKAIDLPPERVRAGNCPHCHVTLYTVEGHERVKCRPCNLSYDVVDLQDATLERLRSYTDTAANVIRVLNAARVPLKMRKLTYWADAGLVPTVDDERGRVYRVGDVLDVIEKVES